MVFGMLTESSRVPSLSERFQGVVGVAQAGHRRLVPLQQRLQPASCQTRPFRIYNERVSVSGSVWDSARRYPRGRCVQASRRWNAFASASCQSASLPRAMAHDRIASSTGVHQSGNGNGRRAAGQRVTAAGQVVLHADVELVKDRLHEVDPVGPSQPTPRACTHITARSTIQWRGLRSVSCDLITRRTHVIETVSGSAWHRQTLLCASVARCIRSIMFCSDRYVVSIWTKTSIVMLGWPRNSFCGDRISTPNIRTRLW